MSSSSAILAITYPGFGEMIVIAIVGLLIFGKRLPEVGRSLGKGIVEFKKGLAGVDDEISNSNTTPPAPPIVRPAIAQQPQAQHKFDPYTGQPLIDQPTIAQQPRPRFDPYTGKPIAEEVGATSSEHSNQT